MGYNHSDILHLSNTTGTGKPVSALTGIEYPEPGSAEELQTFQALQHKITTQYRSIFLDPGKPRTVIVVPSLSMDTRELKKISGVHYYEERLLCMLMLLRLPRTRLIFVSSQPISPSIIDYYLHLLPGIPETHARKRLALLNCYDSSPVPLTQKILNRPRLMQRIREAAREIPSSHITCFNTTSLERTLAVRLEMPLYACDPSLSYLGSKSGSRKVFKEAGILVADGFEDLRDDTDIVDALVQLKQKMPSLRKAVVKLNEGFSGEGNAIFSYTGSPEIHGGQIQGLKQWVRRTLPTGLKFEAAGEQWDSYLTSYREMGGIVEAFIEGEVKRSPSVQCRINPLGEADVISTHDQVLGGPSGQIFLGCTFPADGAYRLELQKASQQVSAILKERSVLGRFGIDFISVKQEDDWQHYAVEINLRKGGTTHPYLMLQFLTDGEYDAETGLYCIPTGQHRYYYASDNIIASAYQGLTPDDLIDIAVNNRLHFHGTTQEGVVFHLIGALSEYGKVGVLCVGATRERALALREQTVHVLDRVSPLPS